MRISQEAENAARIVCSLASNMKKMKAKEIAEETNISLRFTLKILRKLILAKIVSSFKGVNGGYILNADPRSVSFGEVIEAIDGPVSIAKTITSTDRQSYGPEVYNNRLIYINTRIRNDLFSEKISSFLNE